MDDSCFSVNVSMIQSMIPSLIQSLIQSTTNVRPEMPFPVEFLLLVHRVCEAAPCVLLFQRCRIVEALQEIDLGREMGLCIIEGDTEGREWVNVS